MPTTPFTLPYFLGDGELRHADNPITFELPSLAERQNVPVGHDVKLMFESLDPSRGGERMWVRVTSHEGDRYVGRLLSRPVTFKFDTTLPITFESRNIISIEAPDNAYDAREDDECEGECADASDADNQCLGCVRRNAFMQGVMWATDCSEQEAFNAYNAFVDSLDED
jgi:hypothetical protein